MPAVSDALPICSYEHEQKVRLLKDIWDDGGDGHHPPGYLARAGEIVVVRTVREHAIGVSHETVLDNTLVVFPDEFEVVATV